MAHESNSGTFLLLGGLAVAAYGYFQGWFSAFGLGPSVTAASTPASSTTTTTAAPAVPALGSVVHSAADVAAQVAANDAYIFPDSATISSPPSGYSLAKDSTVSETGTNDGTFYLRNDVANAIMTVLNAAGVASNAAGGTFVPATLTTLYQYPISSLSQIQSVMKSAGLSGLGQFQRHMYYRTGRIARVA